MLLEIEVLGSAEWFEQVYPKFKVMGFEEVSELKWADPETDGELMGYYFDYTKKEGIPVDEFALLLSEMQEILANGEAPYVKMKMVKDKRNKNSKKQQEED
jgi:hypothetical protein